MKEHGIDFRGRARQMLADDLRLFDYVLAMDKSNLSNIQAMTVADDEKAVVSLFLQYAYDEDTVGLLEVPDPYYNGRFDTVYDLVYKGSQALLKHIRAEHDL